MKIAFFNGQFLPPAEIAISPFDRGFLFADSIYEVVRIYGGRLFAADRHWQRLRRSAEALALPLEPIDQIASIADELVSRNGLSQSDAILYVQITRGVSLPRRHSFPAPGTPPTVLAWVMEKARPLEKLTNGVPVITASDQRWTRCDVKSTSLLPNVMAAQAAAERNAEETLLIRDGFIMEGGHSSFAAIHNGVLRTAPLSPWILPGVTRQVILELARSDQWICEEFPLRAEELAGCSEAFLLSTTSEVMPVVAIDGRAVGSGQPGTRTRRLQSLFERGAGLAGAL